jgi:hypothetical protein
MDHYANFDLTQNTETIVIDAACNYFVKRHPNVWRSNKQQAISQQVAMLRKVRVMYMGRDALQPFYFLSNDKAWRILRVCIVNLLRFGIQTNITKSNGNSRLVALRVYASQSKAFALALALSAPAQIAAADSRLIMVTSDYCPYCQAWELDIGVIYGKSPYAPSLPLTRVDIGSKMPGDVTFRKPVVGTPTFLIILNGQEIDRQRGYIDAEMFWWWLSEHTAK